MSLATLQLGRLTIGAPPVPPSEPVGDPATALGGAVVPNQRQAPQFQLALATYASAGLQTAVQGQKFRRQLRSLLNNSALKFGGFLYVVYTDDHEQDGWYAPDATTLAGVDKASWKAVGLWQTPAGNWYLIGRQRTHREARQVWMKDLRTGQYERDYLGWLLSTDFSALPALELTVLANGVTQAATTVAGAVVSGPPLPEGRDAGTCQIVQGLADLTVVSYERPEAALNLSDVIVYDRRGQITAPATGPDTNWEEVYGPDYPWNWLTVGQPNDTPVLDNGLVRVRYDGTNTPGFRIDVWNETAYAEQGKLYVTRTGDVGSNTLDNTWVSAGIVEYTPDRAVMLVVLEASSDSYSRERIYITVQRGELGVTFECYPAVKANGSQADSAFTWNPALSSGAADQNASVTKIDSQGSGSWTPGGAGSAAFAATAGTGSGTGNNGEFGAPASLGNANFTTSENWVALLRCPISYATVGAYQCTLVLLQAANALASYGGSDSNGYGVNDNRVRITSQNGAGYVQVQLAFAATRTDQVNEAEAIQNTGSGTTSIVADATASGSESVQDTQTAETNNTLLKSPTSLLQGTYRVFARVKVDAGATGSFRAAGGGSVVTSTSTAWVWLDLGEIAYGSPANFALNAWRSAGSSGAVYVDRVELVVVQDRVRNNAIFSGARDAAQSALYSSYTLGDIVAR